MIQNQRVCQQCGQPIPIPEGHTKTARTARWRARHRKRFCSSKCRHLHRRLVAKRTVICKKCGKAFDTIVSHVRRPEIRGEVQFCSRACRYSTKTERTCLHCKAAIKGCNRKFCSRKCQKDFGRITKQCKGCSKQFGGRKSVFERKEFCSRQCKISYNHVLTPIPLQHRKARLKYVYNITLEDYERMLRLQAGGCAFCKKQPNQSSKRLAVDHAHDCFNHVPKFACPDCIRGLLCDMCNKMLGYLETLPNFQTDFVKAYLKGRPLTIQEQMAA